MGVLDITRVIFGALYVQGIQCIHLYKKSNKSNNIKQTEGWKI